MLECVSLVCRITILLLFDELESVAEIKEFEIRIPPVPRAKFFKNFLRFIYFYFSSIDLKLLILFGTLKVSKIV